MVPCGAGEAATCLVSWAWEPMSTTTYLYGLEASPMPWPWRQAISTPASCTTTAAFAAGVTAKTASLVTGEIRYCSRPIRYSKPGHEGPPRPRRPTYLVWCENLIEPNQAAAPDPFTSSNTTLSTIRVRRTRFDQSVV